MFVVSDMSAVFPPNTFLRIATVEVSQIILTGTVYVRLHGKSTEDFHTALFTFQGSTTIDIYVHGYEHYSQIRSFVINKAIFFKAFNRIFGKVGRNASEEVLFALIKSKCLKFFFYSLSVTTRLVK